MRPVVSHSWRLRQIRGRDLRRQRMQFQRQQSKSSYIRRPPLQVASKIFFQFVARNLFSEVSERAAGFSYTRSASIIRRWNVRPVVVKKRTHVQQIVDVEIQFFQIARQLGGPVNV